MFILTESQKNAIKRTIGEAFLNILKQATIRIILQKSPDKRQEKEIDHVVKMLKTVNFLKKNSSLTYSDYRELAQLVTYEEYKKGEFIYEYGDEAQCFFFVLNGSVAEQIHNTDID